MIIQAYHLLFTLMCLCCFLIWSGRGDASSDFSEAISLSAFVLVISSHRSSDKGGKMLFRFKTLNWSSVASKFMIWNWFIASLIFLRGTSLKYKHNWSVNWRLSRFLSPCYKAIKTHSRHSAITCKKQRRHSPPTIKQGIICPVD